MISSINISVKTSVIVLICLTILSVSSVINNPGVSAQEIPAPLEFKFLANDKPPPQAASMTTIRWHADAAGGVGAYTYEFRTLKDSEEEVAYSGPSSDWKWAPTVPGNYRLRVIIRDTRGNRTDSGWSPEYEITPRLLIEAPVPDRPAPQAAAMTAIRWTAEASGGVGAYTYEFRTLKDRKEKVVYSGPSPELNWTPEEQGIYRVKAAVRDIRGNVVESGWSPEYEIAPELMIEVPVPDRPAPQAAAMTTIRWSTEASGGVGAYTYEFRTLKDRKEKVVYSGQSPELNWTPAEQGIYRIKAVVRDAMGNKVESGWSPEYEIAPELLIEAPVPDRPAPQTAVLTTIKWTAKASGGVGAYTYELRALKDRREKVVYSGPSPELNWTPEEQGIYRMMAVVRDIRGNIAESRLSPEYEIKPELSIEAPVPDRPAPQAASMTTIRWTAKASGGVGAYTYEFRTLIDREEKVVYSGPSPGWEWAPVVPGYSLMKVIVTDALGNTADSGWSPEYEIVPKLLFEQLVSDKLPPQAALMTTIRWTAKASGGVAPLTYEFHTIKDDKDKIVQTGPSPELDWIPPEQGMYRIKAVVKDIRGNTVESGWSSEYEIMPELLVEGPVPDRPSPEIRTTPIRWTAASSGGVGGHSYEFHIFRDSEDKVVQKGPSPYWDWMPMEAGYYRIKAVVRDTLGNTVDSGWSPYYEIVSELEVELAPDRPSPQAAFMTAIRWTAKPRGGVSDQRYEFHVLRDSEDKIVQTGPLPYWDWTPQKEGLYRIKVIVSDRLGNISDSGWSPEFEIAPRLLIEGPFPDRPSPQAAVITTISWNVMSTGGVGDHTYEFHTLKDSEDKITQAGPSPAWNWVPVEAGTYRIKAVVRDIRGNRVESDWSPEYVITPHLHVEVAPDKPAPQAAEMTKIRWTATAVGGVGAYTYEFHTLRESKEVPKQPGTSPVPGISLRLSRSAEVIEQTGTSPFWEWTPQREGLYRIRVVVKDTIGNIADSGWSPEYEIAPKLVAEQPAPDRPAPQAAAMTTIRWTARAKGGVGAYTYEFRTLKDSAEILAQTGPSPLWDWIPPREGLFRVKVVVRDILNNTVDSGWSPEYEIVPELIVGKPVPDRPPPQAAVTTRMWWNVSATGGVGDLTYEFHFIRDAEEKTVQTGPSPMWNWSPGEPGKYGVKVIVRDTLNNTVDSGWSTEYEISAFTKLYAPIAVLPVANISRQMAPVTALRQSMKGMLNRQGLKVLNDDVLEGFMAKHRIRYTSGLDRDTAREFAGENMAGAVLITTLEHYDEIYPPKAAITARLVSTKDKPEILWMDSVGLAGDDSPEILGLGLIRDPGALVNKAAQRLSESFASYLKGNDRDVDKKKGWLQETRFEPKVHHRSSDYIIDRDREYTVAVFPFFNRSDRRYAGEMMEMHFEREMEKLVNFQVTETGVVRDALLKLRVIMYDGISLSNAESIFSMLNVDFILTGTVIDYEDYVGPAGKPKVDFSVLLIERKSREAIWTSKSYNEGDDDVYFFDLGRVNTGHAMAAEMVRAVVKMMFAQ